MQTSEQRAEKWRGMSKGASETEQVKVDVPDFGLGAYMPLNASLGGQRNVLPQSVATNLFNRASAELNVNDEESLMAYWQAREDALHAVADAQLEPENAKLASEWVAANPAPPPVPLRSDGVPADGGDGAPATDDLPAKWKALSGGGDRVAKWKALSSKAAAPNAEPPAPAP